jgi:hypothetical protein
MGGLWAIRIRNFIIIASVHSAEENTFIYNLAKNHVNMSADQMM